MVERQHYENEDHRSEWSERGRSPGGSRMVVDPEGRTWTVREIDAAHVPGARARRSLIFDTAGCCFRVWQYPQDWRDLLNDELLALGRIGCDD